MQVPSKVLLLCGDCGVIDPFALGSQYRSLPEVAANAHITDNRGHVVALYRLEKVVT